MARTGRSGVRVACLLVPDLPLVAERRAHPELAGRPLAIAAGPGPRAELLAVSPEAARVRVSTHQSVAQARAVCAALEVRVASPALERAARDALLDAALSVAPRAELAPRGTGAWLAEVRVFADAGGVAALHRSEAGFAAALAARARALGLPATVAVAGSRGSATLAARHLAAELPARLRVEGGAVRVLSPAEEKSFLASLPVALLDPDDALAEALLRFGIRRVGELARLPRAALATRLGSAALPLLALAHGEPDALPIVAPREGRLEEALDLEWAVDRLEPLAFVLRGLLARLLVRLAARRLACGELDLVLGLAGGGRDARRIGVAAPSLDPRGLLGLVRLSLEARPPAAPVEHVALATEGRPLRPGQLDLFRATGLAPDALGRLLAELAALCGEDRVGTPAVADDWRPGAFSLRPFEAPAAMEAAAPATTGGPAVLALRALRPPLSAEVRSLHGRPERLRSAVANGHVLQAAGPWRTSGAWWSREERFAYDHYDVQTSDGSVVRLRHDLLRDAWEVDAIYD